MTMQEVVGHTFDQLRMIYDAHVRERAIEKLLDTDILAGVISAAFGKSGILKQATTALGRQARGEFGIQDSREDTEKNIKAHVARLMAMGARKV